MSNIYDLEDLEGKLIYVLQIELPGIINFKDRPEISTLSDGKWCFYFSGVKKMNIPEIDKEEKKIHLYTNTIKEGKFSLYFELSNEIISIEHTYLGNTYVDGVYTFYYCGDRKDEDFDENDEEITFQ